MEYRYYVCFVLGSRLARFVNRWFIYDETDLKSQYRIRNNSCEFRAGEFQNKDKMWLFVGQDLKYEVGSDFWELKSNMEININSLGRPKMSKIIALKPLDSSVFKYFLVLMNFVNGLVACFGLLFFPIFCYFRVGIFIFWATQPSVWHTVEAKQ